MRNPPVLLIEAPKMDDENISKLHDFIKNLLETFEWHYHPQLSRYERRKKKPCERVFYHLPEDQNPF